MGYVIYENGGRGVCPMCSGMLVRRHDLSFVCFDCKREFVLYGEGRAERECRYQLKAKGVKSNVN